MRNYIACFRNEWFKITHRLLNRIFFLLVLLLLCLNVALTSFISLGDRSSQWTEEDLKKEQQAVIETTKQTIQSLEAEINQAQDNTTATPEMAPATGLNEIQTEQTAQNIPSSSDIEGQKQILENARWSYILQEGFDQKNLNFVRSNTLTKLLYDFLGENDPSHVANSNNRIPEITQAELQRIVAALAENPAPALTVYKNILEGKTDPNHQSWIKIRLASVDAIIQLMSENENLDKINASALQEFIGTNESNLQALEWGYLTQSLQDIPAGTLLTDQMRKEIMSMVAADDYKIRNNLFSPSVQTTKFVKAYKSGFSQGFNLFTILLIIIAGGMIAHEFATGSIKSLIISPIRRQKIFWAKYGALLCFGLIGTIFLAGIAYGISGLCNGFSATEHVFRFNGQAYHLPFALVCLIKALLTYLDTVCIITFAFALSALFKSTALAIACGVIAALGAPFASLIVIAKISPLYWLMPYVNMMWEHRIFQETASFTQILFTPYLSIQYKPSVLFSIVYLLLAFLVLLWLARDAFCRSDIK